MKIVDTKHWIHPWNYEAEIILNDLGIDTYERNGSSGNMVKNQERWYNFFE